MTSGSGAKVGNAYLEVTPRLDKSATKGAAADGSGYGGAFSGAAQSALSAGAVALGNILSNAAQSAAAAVGDLFKTTFSNYANYEQLVGGVDTLFKESSAIVQQNAANAFKTAGMSANEYMEQVTGFSASLLQGLGGDTEAAASYADMAVRDMSDNANKMGTDMERITDAYQGFAKQNYTMLDNLKLGYGGTKGEMERLLKDASKIAGVEFNIDNYNDVIEAIHVMQEEMGITGTTALEAEETIEGSVNMMKASFDNLLTGLLDENADVGALFDTFLDSVGTVAENLAPRFAVLFSRIVEDIPQAFAQIPDLVRPMLENAFGDAGTVAADGLQGLFDAVSGAVGFVQQWWPQIQETVGATMGAVVGFVSENWPLIQEIVGTVSEAIMQFIMDVWPTVSETIGTVMGAVMDIIGAAWPIISDIISTVMGVIGGVINTVWPAISTVIKTAVNIIVGVIRGISSVVANVKATFEGIKKAITSPIETAKNVIKGIIDTIKGFFSGFKIELPKIKLPHFAINPPGWQIGDLLQGKIPSLGIDWYAEGGIVDGARLIGAGEAGPEMVLPKNGGLMDDFSEAVSAKVDMAAVADEIRSFKRDLGRIIEQSAPTATPRQIRRMNEKVAAYA